MKITDIKIAVVEANYGGAFARIYADEDIMGVGESFLVPGPSRGEICHDC